MHWIYDDGGRAEAGYTGSARDCVCRAISIATERPYSEIYDLINEYAKKERKSKNRREKSSARMGVWKPTTRKIMDDLGWEWTPTMFIGQGCKVHIRSTELPSGRVMVQCSKHVATLVNGMLHDTHESSRGGTRCVYGYWTKR